MNNLEGISFDEVINTEGLTYPDYRRTIKPDYYRTWKHITLGFVLLLTLIFLFLFVEKNFQSWFLISIPLFSVLIGFTIAFLNLFIHEAGHYYLHKDKKQNDLLANIFLCSWTGLHIKMYRKIHWLHHQHLASEADPENSYFRSLSPGFILESLSGIHLLKIIFNKHNQQLLENGLRKKSLLMLIIGFLINVAILLAAILTNRLQLAIVWVLAMLVFFPFFASLRQLIEHRDELAAADVNFYKNPQRKISRIFTNSILSQLIGSAGFNKHMIHHWDPQLPFTALKKVETFLEDCEKTKDIIESSKTTYFSAFKKLWLSRQ